jgi:hypothetical protein
VVQHAFEHLGGVTLPSPHRTLGVLLFMTLTILAREAP